MIDNIAPWERDADPQLTYAYACAQLRTLAEQMASGDVSDADLLERQLRRAKELFTFCEGRIGAVRALIKQEGGQTRLRGQSARGGFPRRGKV